MITNNLNQVNAAQNQFEPESWYRETHTKLADAEFRSNPSKIENCDVQFQGVNFGTYGGNSFRNFYYRDYSQVQMTTDLQLNASKQYYLNLDHCSTLVGGVPSAKIDIIINGQTLVSSYSPEGGGNFIQQHADITSYLQEGRNEIVVKLSDDSVGAYWLQSMSIIEA